ncbi:hypothetical protein CspeluHIS016_0400610 [Cutaneotrichosporon spelunceum]|uniref:Uncharacterized protein n=1 Tax=Cutaneotrichosporon spelunceum TaxID=1672016 RepID=A0AAD3TUM9_9TREE|nr:hypothetical protein CspeluHIS016_0400610 [Cutaneotrichosporon spelunceum]
MPPRRSTAGSKAAPGDACEVRTSAINVPKIMEHLCEVQVADVALVNSITALDGKVDRLLQHFGVQVGSAVGIHGKVDALIAALHVGENRE